MDDMDSVAWTQPYDTCIERRPYDLFYLPYRLRCRLIRRLPLCIAANHTFNSGCESWLSADASAMLAEGFCMEPYTAARYIQLDLFARPSQPCRQPSPGLNDVDLQAQRSADLSTAAAFNFYIESQATSARPAVFVRV